MNIYDTALESLRDGWPHGTRVEVSSHWGTFEANVSGWYPGFDEDLSRATDNDSLKLEADLGTFVPAWEDCPFPYANGRIAASVRDCRKRP